MTITLPADPDTERLARNVAKITGKSLPLVVKEAIEAKAAEAGVLPPARAARTDLLARMTEITDGFARLPILDPRTADEIIGYDERGVAR